MAFTAADWTYDWVNKTVTNDDSGTGNNLPVNFGDNTHVGTVLDLFKDLATEAAKTANMDNYYPMQSDTPTVFKFLNGWTFGHADDYKYLEGGSIEDPSGSGTATADSLWSNAYTIGSQTVGTQIYLVQNEAEVSPWWISGNVDILVLVKDTGSAIQSEDTSGTLTDGGIWFYAREFGDLYDHNFGDIYAGGRNPIGVNTAIDGTNASGEVYVTVGAGEATTFTVGSFATDGTAVGKIRIVDTVNERLYLDAVRGGDFSTGAITEYVDRELQTSDAGSGTATGTTDSIAGITGITNTFNIGAVSKDLNNGNGLVTYDATIDANGNSISDMFEWLKYITRYGSTGATYTVNSDEGQEYRSAIEGTYAESKTAPFGTLAGTTFYGARGIWVENALDSDFVLIDASNSTQSPPNLQKVQVDHASLSGTNIFVAEISGGNVVKNQYTIGSVTGSTIVTDGTPAIDPDKTPVLGTLRVDDVKYAYTSFDGNTFSGVTPDPTGETGDFYVPLLDVTADAAQELSANIVYNSDVDVRTSVRKYGFKPYEVDTTFGSTGLTFSPILTTDPQAT